MSKCHSKQWHDHCLLLGRILSRKRADERNDIGLRKDGKETAMSRTNALSVSLFATVMLCVMPANADGLKVKAHAIGPYAPPTVHVRGADLHIGSRISWTYPKEPGKETALTMGGEVRARVIDNRGDRLLINMSNSQVELPTKLLTSTPVAGTDGHVNVNIPAIDIRGLNPQMSGRELARHFAKQKGLQVRELRFPSRRRHNDYRAMEPAYKEMRRVVEAATRAYEADQKSGRASERGYPMVILELQAEANPDHSLWNLETNERSPLPTVRVSEIANHPKPHAMVVTDMLITDNRVLNDRMFSDLFHPATGTALLSGSSTYRYGNTIVGAWIVE